MQRAQLRYAADDERWMDKREQLMANVVESINITPISSDYLNA